MTAETMTAATATPTVLTPEQIAMLRASKPAITFTGKKREPSIYVEKINATPMGGAFLICRVSEDEKIKNNKFQNARNAGKAMNPPIYLSSFIHDGGLYAVKGDVAPKPRAKKEKAEEPAPTVAETPTA